jgi:phosphoglycerate dehydrogenase-like enzyme
VSASALPGGMQVRGRITVLDDYHAQWRHRGEFDALRDRLALDVLTEPTAPDDLPSRLRGSPIVVALRERTRFDRPLLARLGDLELIAQTGNGVAHIDMDAATHHGVAVAVLKGSEGGSVGTAELTLALVLALLRGVPHYDAEMKQGGWSVPYGRVLHGTTVGLVGVGKVGRRVARMVGAFEARALAWSPTLDAARAAEIGVEAAPLERVFEEADVVSLHVPLTSATRGLVGADLLGRMKPTAVLVNTARGAIVDEAALVEALAGGRIAGAGLDVFAAEPLPADHALRSLPNVVLTPHAGWPTDHAYGSFVRATATLIERYLRGDARHLLNPEALDRPRPNARLFGSWPE